MSREKIVLAYSGGLDTSVAIKWLQEEYHFDVIAMVADLGEDKNLNEIKKKALNIGAISCHVVDLKETFAQNYLAKALKSNALYEGVYPLISALSRPLIAQKIIEIAHQEKAIAVAHGCTGKGNDQVRFDVSLKTLDPNIKIIAPVRENPMSREEAIAYAIKHQIPIPIGKENPFSIDMNLWGRSCECGVLEDPWCEPPEAAYALTNGPEQCPEQPDILEIQFEQGLPTALNNEKMSFHTLIAALNEIAGQHGVGRIDHVENRLIGIKSREIYEAPAAVTLIKAHQALEALCLTRDVSSFKALMEQKFANLVYDGLWFSPLFKAVNAFMDETQKHVTGTVRLNLFKGNITITGRKSPHSLYQYELATYKNGDAFDHQAAKGFIKLFGLPLEVHSKVNKEHEL
ncbi:argininosuccinate synthase [Legionella israelensis]|uniref:Argininosuccinate synthase n=1 Tax=Legionella israelensis TaxID=454 RepID=A0A0W0V2U3_9GAMM|nr:argininosuccinate synthase [Legionella israelensis]KTD14399.1 argininosuccinate synthase [Legionella israelensis]QBS10179.1 argininosuccinate synthase [Legionella israelensis]SCY35235.1 argininosuccinate synthase [Legionella israelensis DSM 19235]STX59770.1 argininosuccinate synthase [Legionella israelensis]